MSTPWLPKKPVIYIDFYEIYYPTGWHNDEYFVFLRFRGKNKPVSLATLKTQKGECFHSPFQYNFKNHPLM
jgi:hypothetical protein